MFFRLDSTEFIEGIFGSTSLASFPLLRSIIHSVTFIVSVACVIRPVLEGVVESHPVPNLVDRGAAEIVYFIFFNSEKWFATGHRIEINLGPVRAEKGRSFKTRFFDSIVVLVVLGELSQAQGDTSIGLAVQGEIGQEVQIQRRVISLSVMGCHLHCIAPRAPGSNYVAASIAPVIVRTSISFFSSPLAHSACFVLVTSRRLKLMLYGA